MNIEELSDLWDADSSIAEDHLDRESLGTVKLHSKYLRVLLQHKIKLAALQAEYNNLRQVKFRYYRGELTKPELIEHGWDQWQGIKPMKSDMGEFLTGDIDLNKIDIKCQYIKVMIEALESILGQIKGRDWAIRNAIEWRKFMAGN